MRFLVLKYRFYYYLGVARPTDEERTAIENILTDPMSQGAAQDT